MTSKSLGLFSHPLCMNHAWIALFIIYKKSETKLPNTNEIYNYSWVARIRAELFHHPFTTFCGAFSVYESLCLQLFKLLFIPVFICFLPTFWRNYNVFSPLFSCFSLLFTPFLLTYSGRYPFSIPLTHRVGKCYLSAMWFAFVGGGDYICDFDCPIGLVNKQYTHNEHTKNNLWKADCRACASADGRICPPGEQGSVHNPKSQQWRIWMVSRQRWKRHFILRRLRC